jgi:predicted AAA+ superfamily ATPase
MLGVELIEGTDLFGDAFEHFIILETVKAIEYTNQEINCHFFRTSDGTEVDLILERHGEVVAVEIKSSSAPRNLRGLTSFINDHDVKNAYCVCSTPRPFRKGGISFLPYQTYVENLYARALFA